MISNAWELHDIAGDTEEILMARWDRYLLRMRENPKDDWTIQQIETVARHCKDSGLIFQTPSRGSHYTVTHVDMPDYILTIPARRSILPVYVKVFVSMIDSIMEEKSESA